MKSPVVVGTDLFVAAKVKKTEHQNEAFGYSFEKLVLYAESLKIGTVWIGGTIKRDVFEAAMSLEENEIMPCVSPLGYPAKKMSLRESMMRKSIKADERLAFEDIVYQDSFSKSLKPENAGKLFLPLEMVRLAPSAANKQPWRMVVSDNTVHFFLKRTKRFIAGEIDLQKVDIGIALCHFELIANEAGIHTELFTAKPDIEINDDITYIASYRF